MKIKNLQINYKDIVQELIALEKEEDLFSDYNIDGNGEYLDTWQSSRLIELLNKAKILLEEDE